MENKIDITNLKLIKTSKIETIILSKVKFFNNFLNTSNNITKEQLNKIIVNISVCSYVNKDLLFFLQHQQKLIESFHGNYLKAVIYYLKKNNLQIIEILEKDIKIDRNILK